MRIAIILAALGAGCASQEQQTWSRDGEADVQAPRVEYGYRGTALDVVRTQEREILGGMDAAVASAMGNWVHLSMVDITCAMTTDGTVTYDEDVEEDALEETVGTGPDEEALVATADRFFVIDVEQHTQEVFEIPDVVSGVGSSAGIAVLDARGVLHRLDRGTTMAVDAVMHGAPDVAFLGQGVLVAAEPVVAVLPDGASVPLAFPAERLDVDPATELVLVTQGERAAAMDVHGTMVWSVSDIAAYDIGVLSDVGVAWILADVAGDRQILLVDASTGADLGSIQVREAVREVSSSVHGGMLVTLADATVTQYQVDRPQ